MFKALIQGTRICDIVAVGDEFLVHEDLVWVDVPDDTTDTDTWVDGAVVKYIEPVRTWDDLRTERNYLLAESDWTQYNDSPLTDEGKAEWAVHRQSLRDLPENTDDPADPTWPTPPE